MVETERGGEVIFEEEEMIKTNVFFFWEEFKNEKIY